MAQTRIDRSLGPVATGTPYGVLAFCLGWAVVAIGIAIEESALSLVEPGVIYSYAHPFVVTDEGGVMLLDAPAQGLLIPAGIVVTPLLLVGYARARSARHVETITDASVLGGTIAVGYAATAIGAAWALELQTETVFGGGTALDPLSAGLSALVTAAVVGGLGGILAHHVDRWIAAAFVAVPFGALLLNLYLAATL